MAHERNAEHDDDDRDGDGDKDEKWRSQEGDGGDQGRGRQPGTRGTGPRSTHEAVCLPRVLRRGFFLFFCS